MDNFFFNWIVSGCFINFLHLSESNQNLTKQFCGWLPLALISTKTRVIQHVAHFMMSEIVGNFQLAWNRPYLLLVLVRQDFTWKTSVPQFFYLSCKVIVLFFRTQWEYRKKIMTRRDPKCMDLRIYGTIWIALTRTGRNWALAPTLIQKSKLKKMSNSLPWVYLFLCVFWIK